MGVLDIIEYYKQLNKYQNDYDKVGWHNGVIGQNVRFKVLLDIGVKDGDTILDFGCGLGDLYGYLIKNNYKVNYLGVDICDFLIQGAKNKYPLGNFFTINDLTDIDFNFDWFISSGVFTYGFSFKEFVHILKEAYKKSNKGLSINMLEFIEEKKKIHSSIKYYNNQINFFNPRLLSNYLKKFFGENTVIQNYDEVLDTKIYGLYTDFTIYIKK
jgi:SAM-dependent methyltransferase